MAKSKNTILKFKVTAKCFGLILCGGTIPEGGFKQFAAVCREERFRYNPRCHMWYFEKLDSPVENITKLRVCANKVSDLIPCKQDQTELHNYMQEVQQKVPLGS